MDGWFLEGERTLEVGMISRHIQCSIRFRTTGAARISPFLRLHSTILISIGLEVTASRSSSSSFSSGFLYRELFLHVFLSLVDGTLLTYLLDFRDKVLLLPNPQRPKSYSESIRRLIWSGTNSQKAEGKAITAKDRSVLHDCNHSIDKSKWNEGSTFL